jgi:hypothetical protein
MTTDRLHIPERLSEREREQALAELRRVNVTLTQLGGWLEDHGEPRAAALLFESWEKLAEAGWVVMGAGGLEPRRVSPNGLSAQF